MATTTANNMASAITAPAPILIPLQSPDSPDRHLFAALERVRAHRALDYSLEHLPDDAPELAAVTAGEPQYIADGEIIWTTSAQTAAGAICRLILLVTAIDQDRWVDKTLMGEGFDALFARVDELDGNAQALMRVIADLLRIITPVGGVR